MIKYTFYFNYGSQVRKYSTIGYEGEVSMLLEQACSIENAKLQFLTRVDIKYIN